MRINRGVLGWGTFLVALGAVALAVRRGLVPEDAAAEAWTLWPLLLVGAGLAVLFRRTAVGPLADLLVAGTFGLILGGILATGRLPIGGCGDDRGSTPFGPESGELAHGATVEVDLSCGELDVVVAQGTGWTVEGLDDDGEGPEIQATTAGVSVDPDDAELGPLGARERWTLTLPSQPTLDLEAQVSAGTARLELEGATLRRLEVGVNAGEANVDLAGIGAIEELEVELNAVGNARIVLPDRSLTGRINANAGSVRVCAPTGAGLRLAVDDNVAAGNNYAARGLVREGDVWETPGYDAADVRIDLLTEVNAGNVELEPEGSCDA